MTYTKDELKKLLTENKCEVTFIKTDGTKRVMNCTLMADVLKPYIEAAEAHKREMLAEGKEVREKVENPNTLSVIDLDKSAWRSFKLDTILSVNVIKE